MTPCDVAPVEQAARRAAVYLYSQTGQLREVTEALTTSLIDSGWNIRWINIEPRVPVPFPWPLRRFFGVFPASVDPEALIELSHPPEDLDSEPDELAVVAYQVWYLAPSLPVRSLLTAYPGVFRDREVVTVIACRNMWYSAAVEVCGLLRSAGALSVDVVAAIDTRPQAITFVTTLRWLLTGRRDPFLRFGRAGVGDDELERVADVGRAIADSGRCPRDAAPVVPTLAVADLLAGMAFRRCGATVRAAGRFGAAAQSLCLVAFVLGLGFGLVMFLPLIACAALAGGTPLNKRVTEFVRSQTVFRSG